jgi:hypothetical protein
VQRYLGMCSPGADFYYPILRKEQFVAAFPDSQIEYARLEDGYYTGGCVFLLSPRPLLANRPLIERVFSSRKSLIKLASLLGWRFVVKMLSRRLSVDDCVRRGSQIIGCDCRVVVDSPPEIALDLDNISDYNFAVLHAGRLNA